MTRKKLTLCIAGFLVCSGVLAACAGFDAGDLVQVKTPPAIQRTEGLPSRMTLNESEFEYRAWLEDTQRNGAKWKENIEKGNAIRVLVNQLTLQALDEVGPTLAGIPVIGPLLPAITGILGLGLGAGYVRKEKEKSYNAGIEKGKTIS